MAETNNQEALKKELDSHKATLEYTKSKFDENDGAHKIALEQLEKIPEWEEKTELAEKVKQMQVKVNIAKAMLDWISWTEKEEKKKEKELEKTLTWVAQSSKVEESNSIITKITDNSSKVSLDSIKTNLSLEEFYVIMTNFKWKDFDEFGKLSEQLEKLSKEDFEKLEKNSDVKTILKNAYLRLEWAWTPIWRLWKLIWEEEVDLKVKTDDVADKLWKAPWFEEVNSEKLQKFVRLIKERITTNSASSSAEVWNSLCKEMWIKSNISAQEKAEFIKSITWLEITEDAIEKKYVTIDLQATLKDLWITRKSIVQLVEKAEAWKEELLFDTLIELAGQNKDDYEDVMRLLDKTISLNENTANNKWLRSRIDALKRTHDEVKAKNTSTVTNLEQTFDNQKDWETKTSPEVQETKNQTEVYEKDEKFKTEEEETKAELEKENAWLKDSQISLTEEQMKVVGDLLPTLWALSWWDKTEWLKSAKTIIKWMWEALENTKAVEKTQWVIETIVAQNDEKIKEALKWNEKDLLDYSKVVAQVAPERWEPLDPSKVTKLDKGEVEKENAKIVQILNDKWIIYNLDIKDTKYLPDKLNVSVGGKNYINYNSSTWWRILLENTTENKSSYTLTFINWGIIENISISQEEKSKINLSIGVAENIKKFKNFFDEYNFSSVWKYREDLKTSMNNNLADYTTENWLINFWNDLLKAISNLSLESSINIWVKDESSLAKELNKFNWWISLINKNKVENKLWEDKFEVLLIKNWIINETWFQREKFTQASFFLNL